MYIRKLRSVVKHILEQPERLIMGSACQIAGESGVIKDHDRSYDKTFFDDIYFTVAPPCKTAACIAGWTVILLGGINPEDVAKYFWSSVRDNAQALLGLTEKQGERLFLVRNWPTNYKRRWKAAKTSQGRAKVLHAFTEKFIETERGK